MDELQDQVKDLALCSCIMIQWLPLPLSILCSCHCPVPPSPTLSLFPCHSSPVFIVLALLQIGKGRTACSVGFGEGKYFIMLDAREWQRDACILFSYVFLEASGRHHSFRAQLSALPELLLRPAPTASSVESSALCIGLGHKILKGLL